MDKLDELLNKVREENPPSFALQKSFADEYINICENDDIIRIISEDKLLPETLAYLIRKKPEYLNHIPKERRNYNLCLLAVKSSTTTTEKIIKMIPKNVFDITLSKECVRKDPKLIRKIPVKMLSDEFLKELERENIDIGSELNFIKTCIDINKLFTENNLPIDEPENRRGR